MTKSLGETANDVTVSISTFKVDFPLIYFYKKDKAKSLRALVLSSLLSGSDITPALSFTAVGLNGPGNTREQIVKKMVTFASDLARSLEVGDLFIR